MSHMSKEMPRPANATDPMSMNNGRKVSMTTEQTERLKPCRYTPDYIIVMK